MSVYLFRSRDLPLSIYLVQSGGEPTDAVLDAIMAHSVRWQVLNLYLPMAMYERLSPLRGQLPRLETLSLEASSWRIDDNHAETLDLFSVAPRLTNVIVGQGIIPSRFLLPWGQVTNLRSRFANGGMQDLLEAAQLFTNLAVLRIYEPRMIRQVNQESPGSVVLLNLKSLKIKHRARNYYIPPDVMGPFFSAISAPSITSLSLYKLSITDHFIPMLSRTDSLLTSINFSHLVGLSEGTLIQCLYLAPALTKLKFREHPTSPTCSGLLFRKLTPQSSEEENGATDTCLVPQLKIIDLSLSAVTEAGDAEVRDLETDLVRMFVARWECRNTPQISQLESVSLNYRFSKTPSGLNSTMQLCALWEEGFPIRLQTRD